MQHVRSHLNEVSLSLPPSLSLSLSLSLSISLSSLSLRQVETGKRQVMYRERVVNSMYETGETGETRISEITV